MIDLRVGQADKQKRRRRRRRKRRHAHVAGQRLSVVANTKFGILMRWALFLEPLRSRSCFHFADLCGHCRLRHRIVIVFGIFMANRRTNFYVLFTKSLFLSSCVSINVRLSLRCCHVEIFPGQTLPADRASNEEVQFRLVIDRYPVAVWVCGIYWQLRIDFLFRFRSFQFINLSIIYNINYVTFTITCNGFISSADLKLCRQLLWFMTLCDEIAYPVLRTWHDEPICPAPNEDDDAFVVNKFSAFFFFCSSCFCCFWGLTQVNKKRIRRGK